MGRKNIYLKNKVLGHVFNTNPYTAPTNFYLGFMSVAPGDFSIGTEISGNGYQREQVFITVYGGYAAYNGFPDTDGYATNVGEVVFSKASPNAWLDIVGFCVFDSPTDGNALYYGTFGPISVDVNGRITIEDGQLRITEN
jgi:hypothetical protein